MTWASRPAGSWCSRPADRRAWRLEPSNARPRRCLCCAHDGPRPVPAAPPRRVGAPRVRLAGVRPDDAAGPGVSFDTLLGDGDVWDRVATATSGHGVPTDARLLAPIESQPVWAAGVTYERSRNEREAESVSAADVYALVYDAERPELFLKASGDRVVRHGEAIGIRRDSAWNVPEPELVIVVDAADATRRAHRRQRRVVAQHRGREPALPAAGQGLRPVVRARAVRGRLGGRGPANGDQPGDRARGVPGVRRGDVDLGDPPPAGGPRRLARPGHDLRPRLLPDDRHRHRARPSPSRSGRATRSRSRSTASGPSETR